jgi:hypothetical protein
MLVYNRLKNQVIFSLLNYSHKKLKGGILYYSLLVLILSTSVVTLILLINYYESRRLINVIKQDELERNVNSALNIFLGGENIFIGSDSVTLDLFRDSKSKVFMSKRRWGNYLLIRAEANWKHLSCLREALVGSDLFMQEPVALLMPDEGRILSLSGNTILRGTCYLPGKTARVASIEGQQYIYKDLVFGELKKSPTTLPELNKSLLSFALNYMEINAVTTDSVININALDSAYYENSFQNKTILIYNDSEGNLSNYCFSGNIVIWSTIPIVIDSSSKLKDVIIFAPKISFKDGFQGELQAFAIQSIRIEDGCRIGFPSQICVLQTENSKYNPADSLIVSIGNGSIVEGGVFINSYGLTSFIKISENSKIVGQVYCPGIIELKGEIIGSLYCKTFYLGTSRARYYNHLLNTRIDNKSLSKHFVGIDLFKEITSKSIIKWVDKGEN